MTRVLGVVVLLLFAVSASAQLPACSQTCPDQTFDDDPFAVGDPSPWTAFNADEDCPIVWDDARLKRTSAAPNTCDHTEAYVRYNGSVAKEGCAIFQLIENTDGAGNATWEVGMGFRHQSDSDSSLFPLGPKFSLVRNETGAAGPLRWATDAIYTELQNEEDALFGTVAVGSWFGACIRGESTSGQIVKVYRWAADPGTPTDPDNWGTPAASATFQDSCISPFGCDDYGTFFVVWLRSNVTGAGGVVSFDNFRAYSCM